MVRRRWKCARVLTPKGYQRKRSRSHRREFVRGGADPKIRIYDFGNKAIEPNDWEIKIGLIIRRDRRISHFALEAIRQSTNRNLNNALGKSGFHVRVRTHPHDTYREHAMMAFAGADRLSSGMRNGFGRPVGKAARINAGSIIMECGCPLSAAELVKKTFEVAGSKISGGTQVVLLKAQSPEIAAKVPLVHAEHFINDRLYK